MLEAMYGLEFTSNVDDEMNLGYGVAVLTNGRVLGGDSSFVYVGSYKIENGKLKASVNCKNDRGLLNSIFGDIKEFEEFNLRLEGNPEDAEFVLQGYMIENLAMKIEVKLTRRAELS